MTLTLAATQTIAGIAGTGSAITYTFSGDEIAGGNTHAFKTFPQGTLPTSAATLYTATSVEAIVKSIFLQNVTASPVTVAMFINGTASTNRVWQGTIPANGSATYDGTWTVYDSSGYALTAGSVGPTGLTGAKGLNWQGAYSAGATYALDDAVYYATLGKSYRSLQAGNIGHTPPAGNDAWWYQLTEKGDTGANGAPGSNGVITTVNTAAPLTGGGSAATLNLDISAATTGARGTMSAADKAKIDAVSGTNTGDVSLTAVGASPNANGASLSGQALTLQPASGSFPGALLAADKRLIDDIHYDAVADFGWIGNDSNDNGNGAGGATAFSAIMTALPTGAVLFFPAGTYRTSVELTINVDKRISFRGVNRYSSIIKTTSATANIFHKSVAGWYDSFSDLGFQSSVTKTAGSGIHISAGNNVGMNIYRVWITGLFKGISAIGSQSANLSVWADLDISSVPNGGRGIHISGSTINVMIHNATINGGAATTSACCEINESGAVQVTACDWIQGTNVLLIDSNVGGASAGPQAVYFTNCFFDQPQGSVILIKGANTANRIKFTQCGIAPTGNNHGIEIAGTGAGAVGTATALPAGISVVDCDIYNQGGTGTGAGIRINGVQDVNIQNSRITGFNGSGGCGVRATPSAGSVTSLRINGCIIGPNSNLTVVNATGIQLDAGNFGRISISDNGIYGWSVAGITDNATTTYTNQKNIADNDGAGLVSGTVVARSTTLSVANTETEVIGFLAQGNVALKVGMELRFQASGIQTNTTVASTSVWRIRIGPTTLTGPIVGSWSCVMGAVARTNVPFYVFGQVTILSATTAIATITVLDNSTTRYALPTTTITAAVTIAVGPADQRVQLTVISGAASTTWNTFAAEIQAVIP